MAADIRIFQYVVPVSADQPSHSYLVNKNQVLLRKTGPMAHMFTKEILWQHIFKSNQNFTPRQPPVAFLFHQGHPVLNFLYEPPRPSTYVTNKIPQTVFPTPDTSQASHRDA